MKRPRLITIFCIISYLGILVGFPQVFSPGVKKLGVFVPAIYGLLVAGHFISTVGVWYMKEWGVQLFLGTFFAKTIFFMLTEQTGWSFYVGLVIQLLFISVQLRFYRKMDSNL